MARENCRDIVIGRKRESTLDYLRAAGRAYVEDGYYLMEIFQLPGLRYYLSPNKADKTQYTVFSERVEKGKKHFRKPVGQAWLNPRLKGFLEISMPLLSRHLYMELFPPSPAQKKCSIEDRATEIDSFG